MCQLAAVLESKGKSLDVVWDDLSASLQKLVLHGSGEERYTFEYENLFGELKTYHTVYEGVIPMLERRYRETSSDWSREGNRRIHEYQALSKMQRGSLEKTKRWLCAWAVKIFMK